MTGFTKAQVTQLLKPINPKRVLRDGKGHSHVSQQDVVAHLIRVFGFGSFDVMIDGPHLVFETERVDNKGVVTGRWDCCYRAKATLIIRDPEGATVCQLEGSATATAQNQSHGDAHDLALKSAESVAKKRAATNLGDQFGLSLYNKGQIAALVGGTYVVPDGDAKDGEDIQQDVPQQVSLGNDEIDRDLDGEPADPFAQQPQPRQQANGHTEAARPAQPASGDADVNWGWLEQFEERAKAEGDTEALQAMKREVIAKLRVREIQTVHSTAMTRLCNERIATLEAAAA